MAPPAREPERSPQRRRPEALDERHGRDPAARANGSSTSAMDMGQKRTPPSTRHHSTHRGARLPVAPGEPARGIREYWWRHGETETGHVAGARRSVVLATSQLPRSGEAPNCSLWLRSTASAPTTNSSSVARDDDTTFGILHSRFHETWSLRLGTSLEDRPRYTPTTTFETFPFPEGLSPNVPAAEYLVNHEPSPSRSRAATGRTAGPMAGSPRMGRVGGRTGARGSRNARSHEAKRRRRNSGSGR